MTVVVDASTVVAALVDVGEVGSWAESVLSSDHLAAPHIMPAEVANVLRRAALSGDISSETAALAHADLLQLRVTLYPYEPLADRAWELRAHATAYDAWYVALAEALESDLATLDRRIARAQGTGCRFLVPPQ